MHSGFISLWRRLGQSDLWLSEPFTRGQAWVDLLMLANHRPGHLRIRGVRVDIPRGYVGYSQPSLASRWRWSRGKIRRFLNELEMVQQIVQQKNNVTTLIKIVNYDQYQIGGTADNTTNDTADGQQTDTNNNDNNVNKDLLSNIPEKISPQFDLGKALSRYSDQQLILDVIAALSTTRKTGKISDSIISAQFAKWERYSIEQVQEGMRKYLDRDCAGEGKGENYLYGIIRNHKCKPKVVGGTHGGFSQREYTGTPEDQISWLKDDEDGTVPEARAV